MVGLFQNGTPPDEIMKSAMTRVRATMDNNPELSTCNVLILNLDHLGKTKMSLNEIRYHREFELAMWPWTLRYGIWVFRDGEVDHSGCDGGWVNWSMSGRYERSGGPGEPIVNFRSRA